MGTDEVFVGREKEIKDFLGFLQDERRPAFVLIGESGIGKSSFLREVVRRIREGSADSGVFVGFHEVLDGTTNVASPFVRVLDDLMVNLSVPLREKAKEETKRGLSAVKKVFSEKGRRFLKSMIKGFASKWFSQDVVDELETMYKEWQSTPSVESIAEQMFLDHKEEFVYDFVSLFHMLTEVYGKLRFGLVIDQFERAPFVSSRILLGFLRAKPERVRVVVSFKAEKEGVARYESIRSELMQLNAQSMGVPPLCAEEIGEWIKATKGKEFSGQELRRIRSLSGGFPFLIANWLKLSKGLDLDELRVGREGYCVFVEWCLEDLPYKCLLFLRRISVLLQPLSVGDYERLTGTRIGECSLFLEKLEKNWILIKQGSSFWFRHDLIKPCVERKLSDTERKDYHLRAAKLFENDFTAAKAGEKVDFHVGHGCAYHFHHAGKFEESLMHNAAFADFCFRTGSLDVAEECYQRAIEAAKHLKDERAEMATIGNLAGVYEVWGRLDDAYKIHERLLTHFEEKKDLENVSAALHHLANIRYSQGDYAKAVELCNQGKKLLEELGDQSGISATLHQLAMIEQARGNYEEATKLYKQSLEIKQKLGDQSGISKSLHQLAMIEQARGNYEEATKLYRQSMDIDTKLGDQSGISKSLHQLAMIEQARGNYEEATKLYRQSMDILQKLGDQSGISATLHQLANIKYLKGNYEEATKLYRQSMDILQKLGDQSGIALTFAQLGLLSEARSQLVQAKEYLEKALQIFSQLGDKPHITQAEKDLQRIQTKIKQQQ